MQQQQNILKFWTDSLLYSYSQLFFSLNKLFAVIILAVTFFDIKIGASGLAAVVLINSFALLFGLNKESIRQGLYGFNALLLGIALGFTYQFTATFGLLFLFSVLLLLVITVGINGFFEKNNLPYLVFPFLFTFWIISLAGVNFKHLQVDINHLYPINNATDTSFFLHRLAHSLDTIRLPAFLLVYFKTLDGIFFQNSILGGMLIGIGLLIHSRITFTLSIIGFVSAYAFFKFFGADTDFLSYYLVGSNFILMAIAIGGFFIVPNIFSYLMVVLLTPILILLLFCFGKLVSVIQLSGYTISFSVLVTMFLYFLHQRWLQKYLHLVTIQYYSAEKTIYKYLSSASRFDTRQPLKMALPFWGTWKVSQGYDGAITHLGDWSKALDFVIEDEQGKTFSNEGNRREDFYCFNKPVLAPMDGYVHSIINTVDDNDISDVNTSKNWGNTIILSHAEGLFSQISHIKKDSFKVNTGDYVSKGTILATCGNSGRSPEPHIHFQVQSTPKSGEKTLHYPVAYFIETKNNQSYLKISEVPVQGSFISNVETTTLLENAFNLTPGKKLTFYEQNTREKTEWEVFTDAWNRTYLYCAQSKSYAYFTNDETMFYFYDFEGNKDSLLFYFYLAFYRVLLGYYPDIQTNDQLPLIHFNNKAVTFIQDFFAPFYLFTKANYQSNFVFADNSYSPEIIEMKSKVTASVFSTQLNEIHFDIILKNNEIHQFSIHQNNHKKLYICEHSFSR
ncbi:MAG: urea transporter [Chitinophagales bacterium]